MAIFGTCLHFLHQFQVRRNAYAFVRLADRFAIVRFASQWGSGGSARRVRARSQAAADTPVDMIRRKHEKLQPMSLSIK